MPLRQLRFIAFHVLAFVLPALGVGILYTMTAIQDVMVPQKPEPPVFPVGSETKFIKTWAPGKRRAVILIGHVGTGITNALIAADVLAGTSKFDVATLAPKKLAVPLTGGVGLWPHFEAEDLSKDALSQIDLLVIPALLDTQNGLLQKLIRDASARAKVTLLLGEGVFAAAEAGVIGPRKVTGPRIGFAEARATFPQLTWIDPVPVVVDGNLVSSAGLLHSKAATLEAAKILDPNVLDGDGRSSVKDSPLPSSIGAGPSLGEYFRFFLRAGYDWSRTNIRVSLNPGLSDAGLAAILDTWPRLLSARTVTAAKTREPVTTRAGLWLLPTISLDQSPPMDKALDIPGGAPIGTLYLRQLQAAQDIADARTLTSVSQILGADWGPTEFSGATASTSPWRLLLRPILIGILGIFAARFLRRYIAFRMSQPRSPLPKSPNPA